LLVRTAEQERLVERVRAMDLARDRLKAIDLEFERPRLP
jgi:hypothetical protein